MNHSEELLKFKAEIDMVAFACSIGYSIDRQKDCKRYRALRKEEDVVLISKLSSGVYWFFNQYDSGDKGTILQFVQTRMKVTLGETRRILRGHMNNPAGLPSYSFRKADTGKSRQAPNLASFHKKCLPLHTPTYLLSRGITVDTIHHQAFKGRIFNYTYTNNKSGKTHTNVAFPIYNESGIISFEQVNTRFKAILEDTLAGEGVWLSNNTMGEPTNPLDALIILEAAIDALSYHQLHYQVDQNIIYLATHGNVTDAQIELILKLMEKRKPSKVILAVDNDGAGSKYRINYLNVLSRYRSAGTVSFGDNEKVSALDFRAGQSGRNFCKVQLKFTNYITKQLNQILKRFDELSTNNPLEEKAVAWTMTSLQANVVEVELQVKKISMRSVEDILWGMVAKETPGGIPIVRHFPKHKDFNDDLCSQTY